METNKKYTYEDLLKIVETLRMPGGCPWDMEQTHESIKHNIIEEGYELVEAIDGGNPEKIADESGDLLLQVVFHAQIGKEGGEYSMDDCINKVCEKLIHRHPHVFGNDTAENAEEVLEKWNRIKREDRGQDTVAKELSGVSKALPGLMRAQKIQKKAEKGGHIFPSLISTAESVSGMLKILDASSNDREAAEKYIGKMLFELVSAANKLDIEPELALAKHIELFIREYEKFENNK